MTLDAGVWALLRDKPDFTPLSLLAAVHRRVQRGWDDHRGPLGAQEGSSWVHDFDLTYTRARPSSRV